MESSSGIVLRRTLEALRHGLDAASAPFIGPRRATEETLILFYNTMWDQPIETEGVPLLDGCRLTTERRFYRDAAAVVFHIPSLRELPRQKPPGQLWVAWSLECDANYPRLRDPEYMRQFDLTMTYRLDADVIVAYTSYFPGIDLASALRTPPKPKPADNLVSLFISSGMNRSGRIEYAAELMCYLDVHAYGKMFRNRDIPEDQWRPSKLDVIANYKFDLAFENAITEDYVSEKFFDPLLAGAVPVYLGAPNVEMFAPGDHCFINTADFSGPKDLAEYLLYLQQHDAEYEAYVAWKDRPLRPAFLSLLERQEEPMLSRLCRVVQARRGGQP
jgi:hypothetical protein